MPYIEVAPDVRLYYEDFGDGPAIVFTHAGLMTHKMWDHQVAALAGRFRTITYDWRGVGASDKPRGRYSVDGLVADLCAFIAGMNLGPVTLVGHGVGSHIALLAAALHPDLVARLVVVSGAPWFKGDRDGEGGFSAEFTEWFNTQLSGSLAPQAYASLSERFMFHRDPGPAVAHWILEMALATPQYVFMSYSRSMAALDHRSRLGKILCRTLVMHGRFDEKQRYEGGVYLAKHLPNARLMTFGGSAHMPQLEEVDVFNRALADFLERDG